MTIELDDYIPDNPDKLTILDKDGNHRSHPIVKLVKNLSKEDVYKEVITDTKANLKDPPDYEDEDALLTFLDELREGDISECLFQYTILYASAWDRWFRTYDYTYIITFFMKAYEKINQFINKPGRQLNVLTHVLLSSLAKTSLAMVDVVKIDNALTNQSTREMYIHAERAQALWKEVHDLIDDNSLKKHWLGKEIIVQATRYLLRAEIKKNSAQLLQRLPGYELQDHNGFARKITTIPTSIALERCNRRRSSVPEVMQVSGDFRRAYAAFRCDAITLLKRMDEVVYQLEHELDDAEGASNIRGHRGTLEYILGIPQVQLAQELRIHMPKIEGATHFYISPEILAEKIFVSPVENKMQEEDAAENFLAALKQSLTLEGRLPDIAISFEPEADSDLWETPLAEDKLCVRKLGLPPLKLCGGFENDDQACLPPSYKIIPSIEFTPLGACSVRFTIAGYWNEENPKEPVPIKWLLPGELRHVLSLLTPLAGQNRLYWIMADNTEFEYKHIIRHTAKPEEEFSSFIVDCVFKALRVPPRSSSYLPHIDWFMWVHATDILDVHGKRLGYGNIVGNPWYRALSVPLRESRASIGDWIAVPQEVPRNLAHIKGHENELLLVDSDRAIMVLPDTPEFLVFMTVAALLASSRIICTINALSINANRVDQESNERQQSCRKKLDELAAINNKDKVWDNKWNELRDELKAFETIRVNIYHLESQLREVLHLIETIQVAAFRDHALFMSAVMEGMDIPKLALGTRELLDQVRNHIDRWTALVAQSEAEARQKKEQQQEEVEEKKVALKARQEWRLNIFLAFVAVTGVVEALSSIDKILQSWILKLCMTFITGAMVSVMLNISINMIKLDQYSASDMSKSRWQIFLDRVKEILLYKVW